MYKQAACCNSKEGNISKQIQSKYIPSDIAVTPHAEPYVKGTGECSIPQVIKLITSTRLGDGSEFTWSGLPGWTFPIERSDALNSDNIKYDFSKLMASPYNIMRVRKLAHLMNSEYETGMVAPVFPPVDAFLFFVYNKSQTAIGTTDRIVGSDSNPHKFFIGDHDTPISTCRNPDEQDENVCYYKKIGKCDL